MLENNFVKKRAISICMIAVVIILIIAIAILLMIRYSVEGEQNMPFQITEYRVVSMLSSGMDISKNDDGEWVNSLLQNNNIYFSIAKNDNYKKEDIIKKIEFCNFNIIQDDGKEVKVYRPSRTNCKYEYSSDYEITQNVEYVGAQTTDTELLQINNQGGTIGFSVVNTNIGTYSLDEDDSVQLNGELLQKLEIGKEDMEFNLGFDMKIETESGKKFIANIGLDLPVGNIEDSGVSTFKETNSKAIVFKRYK